MVLEPRRAKVAHSAVFDHAGRGGSAGRDTDLDVYLRLVAPPFNLFAGEEGVGPFRRRLRALVSARRKGHSVRGQACSAAATLSAAAAELPAASLSKPITEFVAHDALPVYDFGRRVSGPLQPLVW